MKTNIFLDSFREIKKIIHRQLFFNVSGKQRKQKTLLNKADDHVHLNTNITVLILIENMSYTYDTRVQNIAKTLAESGYQIKIICPRYVGDPRRLNQGRIDVRYYYLPPVPAGFLGYLIEYSYSFFIIFILAIFFRFHSKVDILHVCNPPDFFFPIGKFFQIFKTRFIYDKHDCVPELFKERFSYNNKLISWLLLKAEKITEKTADHIITTNASVKKSTIIKNKIQVDRISVVRNGPNINNFPKEKHIKSDKKKIKIGYVGNMNPQDCVDSLLKIANYIKYTKKRSDIHFILIGNGSAFENLKIQSVELNVNDIVEFTGRLQPASAYRRLSKVDICVQPDLKNSFTDSCTMIKDLEYMALTKPIVAFDLKETRFSCGKAALYATNNSLEEFAKNILKLVDDAKLRDSMGKLGHRRLIQKFTWSYSRKPLLEAYKKVLNLS